MHTYTFRFPRCSSCFLADVLSKKKGVATVDIHEFANVSTGALTHAFSLAKHCAPSVLLLPDIELLFPHTHDTVGSDSSSSSASFFLDLFRPSMRLVALAMLSLLAATG